MNLEDLEQKVLAYLKQAANPLVPMAALLGYLRKDDRFAEISERDLMDFLAHHELFRVIHPGGFDTEPELSEGMSRAGVNLGPSVILDTRIPTPRQMAELMVQQLEGMNDALTAALQQARAKGDSESEDRLLQILARAERVRKQLGLLKP